MKDFKGVKRKLLLLLGVLLIACGVLLAGCDDDDDDDMLNEPGDTSGALHANVVLKDRFGTAIAPDSSEPYSPRQTCGSSSCHDIDLVANGYHFQQGRTDMEGNLITMDDFFGDGRPWVKSAGMYGKW